MNTQSAGNNNVTELTIYNKNESILDVAEHFDISYAAAWSRLKKQGRVSKKKKPVYSNNLNREFFEIIDNEVKAYFLGFLKADGYLDKSRNRLALRLQERDDVILKRYCDALNLPIKRINKIVKNKDSKYYSANQQDCVEVAVTNRKFTSYIWDLKDKEILNLVPEEFAYDFIRGYFDGDGCISYRNMKKKIFQMNIMGNPNDDHMLKYIQKYFPNLIIYTDKRSDLPLIQCGHNAEIINFANKVYKDAIIYLPRKKQKFDLVRFTNLIGTSTTTRETTKELVEDIV